MTAERVLSRVIGKVRGFAPAAREVKNYVVIFCGWDPEYGDVFSCDCPRCGEHFVDTAIENLATMAYAYRWGGHQ